MEFLNAQAKYIAGQLRSMSIAQRAVIALLLVIVTGGMWWMVQWGRQAEWTELLPQSLTAEEMQRVEAQLALIGLETRREGDRLLIHGDEQERRRATAVLAQGGGLPKNISLGYEALVKEGNVWESDQVRRWKQNRALEAELSAVVGQFHGVRAARVQIVVPESRVISPRASTASASVNVTPEHGAALDKQKILAIANYVAGAVPGLDVANVTLTDGNRSYRAPDSSDGLASSLLELQREWEESYTAKIYDQLRHIKGVVVNVNAKLRQDDEQMTKRELGQPTADKVEEESEETQGAVAGAGPGVRPNQGREIAGGGGGAAHSKTKSVESLNGQRDQTDTQIVKKAGAVERVLASVSVPSSYLQRILAARQPDVKTPAHGDLQKIADAELPKIAAQVRPLVMIGATEDKQNELIVVDWYYDGPAEAAVPAEAASLSALTLVKGYGPHVGLGVLAVLSLLMVWRIARKAPVSAVPAGAGMAAAGAGAGIGTGSVSMPLRTLGGGPQPVGEAQEIDGILMGHEVDKETVRTQQIVKQITQMAKDDPAAVSGVVDFWLKDEK
jgi:flagellar M-ring protein FliF